MTGKTGRTSSRGWGRSPWTAPPRSMPVVEDCGIPSAEGGGQLGVSTSVVSKMIRRRKSNSI